VLSSVVAASVVSATSLVLQTGLFPVDIVTTGTRSSSQAMLQLELQSFSAQLANTSEDLRKQLHQELELHAEALRTDLRREVWAAAESLEKVAESSANASGASIVAAVESMTALLSQRSAKLEEAIQTLGNRSEAFYTDAVTTLQGQAKTLQVLKEKSEKSPGRGERKAGGAVDALVRESFWGFLSSGTGNESSSSASALQQPDSERKPR